MGDGWPSVVHRKLGPTWPPILAAVFFVVACLALLLSARHRVWAVSASAACVMLLLLPTVLVWLAVGVTFAQICVAPTVDDAWHVFRRNSGWVANKSGVFDWAVRIHPDALALQRRGTPAIYVLNHFPAPIFDTCCCALLGIPCRVVTGCMTMPVVAQVYRRLGSIDVRPGGGNTERILDEAHAVLKGGQSVVVFGEGRHAGRKRRWDEVVDLQLGAFLIAAREQCPVIPVALCDPIGAYGIIRPSVLFGLPQSVTLNVLAPLRPHHFKSPMHMRDAAVAALNRALKLDQ